MYTAVWEKSVSEPLIKDVPPPNHYRLIVTNQLVVSIKTDEKAQLDNAKLDSLIYHFGLALSLTSCFLLKGNILLCCLCCLLCCSLWHFWTPETEALKSDVCLA